MAVNGKRANSRSRTAKTAPAPPRRPAGVELKLAMGTSMMIDTGNAQHQGARPYQEDSFGCSNIIDSAVLSERGMLAILSDGMGGLSNGKAVADRTVQASISMFDTINPRGNISEQLQKIAYSINDSVCRQYADGNGVSRAGATMVLAYIFKNRIYWVTVGDSRLYLLRNGNMMQMNEDHDYKNQLFREYLDGSGSLRAIEADPQKDNLVCFIGKSNLPYVDASVKGYRIKPNDIFVLCSDGIYNAITEDTMKDILIHYGAQAASDKIVSAVMGRRLPGQDNMTVMVIKCKRKNNFSN